MAKITTAAKNSPNITKQLGGNVKGRGFGATGGTGGRTKTVGGGTTKVTGRRRDTKGGGTGGRGSAGGRGASGVHDGSRGTRSVEVKESQYGSGTGASPVQTGTHNGGVTEDGS